MLILDSVLRYMYRPTIVFLTLQKCVTSSSFTVIPDTATTSMLQFLGIGLSKDCPCPCAITPLSLVLVFTCVQNSILMVRIRFFWSTSMNLLRTALKIERLHTECLILMWFWLQILAYRGWLPGLGTTVNKQQGQGTREADSLIINKTIWLVTVTVSYAMYECEAEAEEALRFLWVESSRVE